MSVERLRQFGPWPQAATEILQKRQQCLFDLAKEVQELERKIGQDPLLTREGREAACKKAAEELRVRYENLCDSSRERKKLEELQARARLAVKAPYLRAQSGNMDPVVAASLENRHGQVRSYLLALERNERRRAVVEIERSGDREAIAALVGAPSPLLPLLVDQDQQQRMSERLFVESDPESAERLRTLTEDLSALEETAREAGAALAEFEGRQQTLRDRLETA